jgi:starch-binding outer membrane protein, SusD/RagB family
MKKIFYLPLGLAFIIGCSDLKEDLKDATASGSGSGSVDPQQLLNGAYGNLRDLQADNNLYAVAEHTSDELAGPTRGRDWDDAGNWRVLQTHSWTTAHPHVNNVWRTLNRNSYNSQQVLCAGATGQIAAQATFLRVFNDFLVLDFFGKVPRRACDENLLLPPTQLLLRQDAIDVLIGELEAALPALTTNATPDIASQNAARALLAKMYLNKAVYKATGDDGGALPGPYTFDPADMNKVIEYADAISASGEYMLEDNYFDNFSPDNSETSTELIFVSKNTSGAAAGNVRSRWFSTLHYNQNPGGWNGFVALTDLYNRFEENDLRRYQELPYLKENNSGIAAGFLVGQQYDANGEPLEDRAGNPLIFTPEFSLRETGTNLESTGIRVIKYPPDFDTPGDAADNDYVFLRYADVLLMKAEAIFRGGSSSETALQLVNQLRAIRGASQLGSLSEVELSDERSRELYLEGWRRNDQIRFNLWLGTWQEKEQPSDPSRLLFPIPAEAISTNPLLAQNPGY